MYGEAPRPTPEDYAPLEPISVYGASKLADEGLLSTYAHSYGFTVWNFRFANVVGSRLRGAVIPDFIHKLRTNPETLTILGDGRQEKSYLHVDDCIDAICHVVQQVEEVNPSRSMYTYNIGTRTTTSVDRIGEIVADVLDVDPEFEYTGETAVGPETSHDCGSPLKNCQGLAGRQSTKVHARFGGQHKN